MIKFFRNIRHSMVNNNRVSKYLLYAIGEIILVVIGILIALQINNWNQNRLNNASRKAYTQSLLTDLDKDSILLRDNINVFQERLNAIESIKDRINGPNATLDTLDKIIREDFDPSYAGGDVLFKNTFATLQSTGHIAYFSPSQTEALQEYYQRVYDFEKFQSGQIDFHRNLFVRILERLPSSETAYLQQYTPVEKGELKQSLWQEVDKHEARLLFRGMTSLQIHNFKRFTEKSKELLDLNRKTQLKLMDQ